MENSHKNIDSEEEAEEEISVEIIEENPSIYEITLSILKEKHICLECLGRQFSFLGTATDNFSRGQAILLGFTMECHKLLNKFTMEKHYLLYHYHPLSILELIYQTTNFNPAKELYYQWIEKHPESPKDKAKYPTITSFQSMASENNNKTSEFMCNFCQNSLELDSIQEIAIKIMEKTKNYEFENFLIGTKMNAVIADQEDEFRARHDLKNGESFKANLNRLVGKKMLECWGKPTEYLNPDLTIIINFDFNMIKYELISRPLYVKGRYNKFVRDLPQTHWNCYRCRGLGYDKRSGDSCPECNGTGDLHSSSVEDLIGKRILRVSNGDEEAFHGAGREDIDARCLGDGRPFIIEIKNPKRRTLDLIELQNEINSKCENQIHVSQLSYSDKKEIIRIKSNSDISKKQYHALIQLGTPISFEFFQEKFQEVRKQMINQIIHQRTPLRVVKRRSDCTRKKKIFDIEGTFIDPVHCFIKIKTQGGTYIKEMISGDSGRTSPSLAGIFKIPMKCVELDVVEIEEH